MANRDLKLENLLLDHDGRDGIRPLLKICDFGYSKVANRPAPRRCSIARLMRPWRLLPRPMSRLHLLKLVRWGRAG